MKKNEPILSLSRFILLIMSGFILVEARGDIPVICLRLKEIEAQAVSFSPAYKSSEFDEESALWSANALKSQFSPKVFFEGVLRYQTEVPEIEIVSGRGSKKMGDNESYSIGPSLQWVVWDKGALRFNYAAGMREYEAKQWEKLVLEKQILLDCRKSYFELLLACEQSVLIMDSLKIALIQYEDIKVRAKAGTKSRMDQLSAHQEVLIRKRQLAQSRSKIANALRELEKLTGNNYSTESGLYPLDVRKLKDMPFDIEAPTHLIELENIEKLFNRFDFFRSLNWNEHQPASHVLEKRMDSLEQKMESLKAGRYPKVLFSARSSFDYPNGPQTEEVFQNTAGISVNMPVFEAHLTEKKEKQIEAQKKSLEEKKEDIVNGLKKEWNIAQDALTSLEEQMKINLLTVKEVHELVDITFKSYQAGALTYVEVQNANFRALESESQLVNTQIQILFNLAKLAYLSEEDLS